MELKLRIRYLRSNFYTLMQILNSFYMQHIKYYADMQIYNTIMYLLSKLFYRALPIFWWFKSNSSTSSTRITAMNIDEREWEKINNFKQ